MRIAARPRLAKLIAIGAAQGCICVIHYEYPFVADAEKRRRKIPLSVGKGGLENHAVYAQGVHDLSSQRAYHCL